jgi:hypothetical protein
MPDRILIVDDEPLNLDLLDQVIGGQPMNKIEELSYHNCHQYLPARANRYRPRYRSGQSRGGRQSSWPAQNSSAENHESPCDQLMRFITRTTTAR